MTTARRDTYTPESLLSVAVRVFNERGYDGTSMEHLSKAVSISKSSIYHHVSGKEELLRRAVSRALDGLFGILDEPPRARGARWSAWSTWCGARWRCSPPNCRT